MKKQKINKITSLEKHAKKHKHNKNKMYNSISIFSFLVKSISSLTHDSCEFVDIILCVFEWNMKTWIQNMSIGKKFTTM